MLHHTLVNLNVTIRIPYVPALRLGPRVGLSSVCFNAVLDSTVYIKLCYLKHYLGQKYALKIQYLAQHCALTIRTC